MADSQLVCVSLIHPPQFQLFSRIHEILWRVFLPQIQLLSVAVEDLQVNSPSSEPKEAVHQIRQVAGNDMIKMFNFVIQAKNVATEYIELLNVLPDVKESHQLVDNISISAFGGTRRTKEMQQHFIKIREELDSGIRRITIVLTDRDQDTPTGITQPVSKLFNAIDELNGLFQECRDYFEETEKQTSDETFIEFNPPSPEETQMMREKWGTFSERLEEVMDGWKNYAELVKGTQIIQDGDIRFSPEAIRANTNRSSPPMLAMEGSKLSYLLKLTRPMDHSDRSASGDRPAATTLSSPTCKTKPSFWRKVIRRSERVNTDGANKPTGKDATAPSPFDSSPTHKSKSSFWPGVVRRSKRVNTDGANKPTDRDATAPSPFDSSPTQKSRIPFWRKLIGYLRRNNSSRPRSDSEAPTHPAAAAATSSNACDNSRIDINIPANSTGDLNHEASAKSPSVLPVS